MDDSRRTFIKQAVGFSVACAAGLDLEELAHASTSNEVFSNDKPEWYQRPMRWAQLAFVEDDPGNYDRSFLARLLPKNSRGCSLSECRRRCRFLSDRKSPALSK